ncbi:hypothetical protein D1871_00875 [Nakamurella silvestris]|nr:hypothetical protein D1871_00875 [Nakamurella silvestris]
MFVRPVRTMLVVSAVAVLVAGCTASGAGEITDGPTSSVSTTTAGDAAGTADAETASPIPVDPETPGTALPSADVTAEVTAAASPLDPVSRDWYGSFCDAAGGVILQPGPQYTAASTPAQRTTAYVAWLTDIIARTGDSRAALADLEPATSLTDGRSIHQEALTALSEVRAGARTSTDLFTAGTPIDGLDATDPAWAELALRPYSSGVDRLNEMVSAHADVLLPPERVHEIEAIGDCGTLLEVH